MNCYSTMHYRSDSQQNYKSAPVHQFTAANTETESELFFPCLSHRFPVQIELYCKHGCLQACELVQDKKILALSSTDCEIHCEL